MTMKKIAVPIPLGNSSLVALVSPEDYERVSQYNWSLSSHGYVVRNNYFDGKNHTQRLHRFIVNAQKGDIVDHKNRDKLDCTRGNLRHKVTPQNSCRNRNKFSGDYTSKYKGVAFVCNRWLAYIYVDGKRIVLYRGDSEEQACVAYNRGARKYFGEFAVLNDIDESLVPEPPLKYKGVTYDVRRKKWKATICVNYKQVQLGRFNTQREAFEARVKAEKEHNFKDIQEWKGETNFEY